MGVSADGVRDVAAVSGGAEPAGLVTILTTDRTSDRHADMRLAGAPQCVAQMRRCPHAKVPTCEGEARSLPFTLSARRSTRASSGSSESVDLYPVIRNSRIGY